MCKIEGKFASTSKGEWVIIRKSPSWGILKLKIINKRNSWNGMNDGIWKLQRKGSHPIFFNFPNWERFLLESMRTFNQISNRTQIKPKVFLEIYKMSIINGPFKALQKNWASFLTLCPNNRHVLFSATKRTLEVFLNEDFCPQSFMIISNSPA